MDIIWNSLFVKVKKLSETAIIPTRGSAAAAGYDLYASLKEPITILPHMTEKIPTDLSFELPEGTFAGIFARSGLATKQGFRPASCVGAIDSDYRGNVIVALYNDSEEERVIMPNERIAQLILLSYLSINFIEVEDLSETERASNGFGSTGV